MSKRGMQPWKCAQGHVLGMIQANARRRLILMLYRHAIDLEALPATHVAGTSDGGLTPPRVAAEVEVMGLLAGGMREIRCDVCGGVQEWTGWRQRRPHPRPLSK